MSGSAPDAFLSGQGPRGWEIVRLGAVASFRTGPFGSALHKSDYVVDGVPVINPMHIIDGKLAPTPSMTVTESAAKRLGEFRLRPGEVVIGRRGDMGRCAVVGDEHAGWLCGTGSMIVRPGSRMDPGFLQLVLSSPVVIAAIEAASVGSTMVNLNQGTLAGLAIQAPPRHEQAAISTAIADADSSLAKLDQLIAKKRNLKQAAVQRLLGDSDGSGAEGPKLPAVSLSKICDFISKGSTPTTYGFKWEVSGVLFLRSECVSEGGLDLGQSMFISLAAHAALRRSTVRHGDLLITITGNVGRVVRFDAGGEANINQHIARIRVSSPDVDAGYVFHVLSQPSYRARFNSITTGQAYPQLSLKQVRDAVIPLRSLPEQRAIAVTLSDMDAELTALEARREKTRQLKQGMMQALLTGRIRLV